MKITLTRVYRIRLFRLLGRKNKGEKKEKCIEINGHKFPQIYVVYIYIYVYETTRTRHVHAEKYRIIPSGTVESFGSTRKPDSETSSSSSPSGGTGPKCTSPTRARRDLLFSTTYSPPSRLYHPGHRGPPNRSKICDTT